MCVCLLCLSSKMLHKWTLIHFGKLTWNLKISCLKRNIIFQTFIVGFHVSFPGVCQMYLTFPTFTTLTQSEAPSNSGTSAVPSQSSNSALGGTTLIIKGLVEQLSSAQCLPLRVWDSLTTISRLIESINRSLFLEGWGSIGGARLNSQWHQENWKILMLVDSADPLNHSPFVKQSGFGRLQKGHLQNSLYSLKSVDWWVI